MKKAAAILCGLALAGQAAFANPDPAGAVALHAPLSPPAAEISRLAVPESLRPKARKTIVVPKARWDNIEGSRSWSIAALRGLRAQASQLPDLVPRDIAEYCPAYPSAGRTQREAFWVGLISALAWHESTPSPLGRGRWRALVRAGTDLSTDRALLQMQGAQRRGAERPRGQPVLCAADHGGHRAARQGHKPRDAGCGGGLGAVPFPAQAPRTSSPGHGRKAIARALRGHCALFCAPRGWALSRTSRTPRCRQRTEAQAFSQLGRRVASTSDTAGALGPPRARVARRSISIPSSDLAGSALGEIASPTVMR